MSCECHFSIIKIIWTSLKGHLGSVLDARCACCCFHYVGFFGWRKTTDRPQNWGDGWGDCGGWMGLDGGMWGIDWAIWVGARPIRGHTGAESLSQVGLKLALLVRGDVRKYQLREKGDIAHRVPQPDYLVHGPHGPPEAHAPMGRLMSPYGANLTRSPPRTNSLLPCFMPSLSRWASTRNSGSTFQISVQVRRGPVQNMYIYIIYIYMSTFARKPKTQPARTLKHS